MNEQIRLLAEQAGLITEQDDRENWQEYINDVSEFAELIVQECIERVCAQYTSARDLHLRTEREQGIVECGVASVIALEELFQESTDRWYKENILRDKE